LGEKKTAKRPSGEGGGPMGKGAHRISLKEKTSLKKSGGKIARIPGEGPLQLHLKGTGDTRRGQPNKSEPEGGETYRQKHRRVDKSPRVVWTWGLGYQEVAKGWKKGNVSPKPLT